MAISWGSPNNGLRVGMEVTESPATVGSGTSLVKITVDYYVGAYNFGWSDNQTLTLSGAATGSWDYYMSAASSSYDYQKVGSKSVTVSTSYAGDVVRSFTAKVSSAYNGASPSHTVSATVSKRPITTPNEPSGFSASRASDNRVNLKWANSSPTSAGAPYAGIQIDRWSESTDAWITVANLGVVTSWDDNGISGNNRYRYRVRSENSAGASDWVYSGYIATTPSAPTLGAVQYLSDTQMKVTWKNNATYFTNSLIERWSKSTNEWRQVASIASSTTTSYTDTTVSANDYYRYRVRSYNGLYSGHTTTLYASTTPAPPSKPGAKRSGTNVVVTWTNPDAREISGIQVWIVTNGVLAGSAAATLTGAVTTWTHVSPDPSKTYSYHLKTQAGADADDASPTLYSALGIASNIVQLLTNPLAPTNLNPTGVAKDVSDPITLTWQHNEVDGSDQTAYKIQWRAQGTGTWYSTAKTLSTESTITSTFPPVTNGQTLEWQVQTWGDYTTEPSNSPWSKSGLITLSAPPAAVIDYPSGTLTDATALVTWVYSDPEGTAQSRWEVRLYDENNVLIEGNSGSGPGTSTTLKTVLQDDKTYTFGVIVWDSAGSASPEVLQTFSVNYSEPRPAGLEVTWDPDMGSNDIQVTNPVPRTYAWEDTVDNSNSTVTDDGVVLSNYYSTPSFEAIGAATEVNRNLALNPLSAGTTGWTAGDAGNTVTKNQPVTGNPQGITTAAKGNSIAGAGTRVFWATNIDGLAAATTERRVGAWFFVNALGHVARIGLDSGTTTPLEPNTWTWVTAEMPTGGTCTAIIQTGGAAASPSTIGYVTGVTAFSKLIPKRAIWVGMPTPWDETVSWAGTVNASAAKVMGTSVTGVTSHDTNGSKAYSSTRYAKEGGRSLKVVGGHDTTSCALFTTTSVSTLKGFTASLAAWVYLPEVLTGVNAGANALTFSLTQGATVLRSPQVPNEIGWHLVNWVVTLPNVTVSQFRFDLGYIGYDNVAYVDLVTFANTDNPTMEPWSGSTAPEIDAQYNRVFRTFGVADQWELIADNLPLQATITDYIPPLSTDVRYKVETVSAIPSSRDSEITEVFTDNIHFWVFVNAGEGFGEMVKARDNARLDLTTGLDKVVKAFAGRKKPLEFAGQQESRALQFSARLSDESSSIEEFEALALLPAPVCVRGAHRRLIVSTGAIAASQAGVTTEISWPMTEVDDD